ncbi:hypothetical protein [Paenibacillus sp. TH7-28]
MGNLESGARQPAAETTETAGRPSNSAILCSYYPGPGMFITISGILCSYFSMNGPDCGHLLAIRENNGINVLYITQMDGRR